MTCDKGDVFWVQVLPQFRCKACGTLIVIETYDCPNPRCNNNKINMVEVFPPGREQRKNRPYLIVSTKKLNEKLRVVVGVALTSKQPKTPSLFIHKMEAIASTRPDTDPVQSWAKMTQIQTIATERLLEKLGHATAYDVDKVREGIRMLFGGE